MQSNKENVQDLISILVQHGLKHVVISPGSRNAPISYSLYHHPEVECYSIPDERVAGYFALGMSQFIKAPVAVVCTSGTAAYNYGPAVAEAFFQKTPLIVLTADRPEEWIAQGEGQSIFQNEIFGKHVRFFAQLKESNDKQARWFNQRKINEAWEECTLRTCGPVHINIPLNEPLYDYAQQLESAPIKRTMEMQQALSESNWELIAKQISNTEKVMILITQNADLVKAEDLDKVAALDNVLVLTESTSNASSEHAITCIDRLLEGNSKEELSDFIPDLLITIGHNIISKKIKALLRSHPLKHWHVDESDRFLDTFQQLETTIPVNGKDFLAQMAYRVETRVNSNYHEFWMLREKMIQEKHKSILAQLPFSDMKVFELILLAIPEQTDLQMGNSSVVRYIQLYNSRRDLRYYGNRGTSGIDGCTSTAIGFALLNERVTTLISGDIAFFYDHNAFWHEHLPANLKVIVVNNGGGGIFRIIPGPASSNALEACFETPHQRSAKSTAEDFGLNYYSAHNEAELAEGLVALYASTGCSILEVFTPRLENDLVLHRYFAALKN